jgi:uncharacterized damage-inducible protein DinB
MSLAVAIDQIIAARRYTVELLDTIDPADWFRMPSPPVTHIAWQVGHLATSQFRLTTVFLREPKPSDAEWMPPEFLASFRRDTVPYADADRYPSPAEIRATFDSVHEHVLAELRTYRDADLEAPVLSPQPHRIVKTKREALFWCSRHEMIHAGQIALLRRLLGQPPMW